LQHLHYPEFFSKADFALREQLYRAFCAQAVYVCVQTQWSKHDVTQHYSISPDKVVVIRWGSVFDAYTGPSAEARQATRQKYNLSDQFFFYPAVTWPHKNHEVILRALHRLKRDHGRKVAVYFTGASTEFRKKLDETARELNIFEQVHYLGFVTPEELQSIFSAATAMVFPSKFEGFGLPILEAFHAQLPVLSSTASVLPEVANDGALYFDPDSPAELAELMIQMLDDPGLRKTLIDQGAAQLSRFSINDTAVSFQRLYAQMTENAAGGNAVQLDRALAAQSMERD
jgi:glycosyltransferase involved in cell wall biosynthesis